MRTIRNTNCTVWAECKYLLSQGLLQSLLLITLNSDLKFLNFWNSTIWKAFKYNQALTNTVSVNAAYASGLLLIGINYETINSMLQICM
jgi:hypothetical protein